MSKFMYATIIATILSLGFLGSLSVRAVSGDLPAAARPNEPALWSTPGDGRLVMLARNAAGFDMAMPIRVRVCVTNVTGANNSVNLYIWTTANPWDSTPAAPQQTRHLELGDCVEIDRPAALIVQDSTVSGTSSGYYQLMEQTTLLTASAPIKAAKNAQNIHLGDPANQVVKCDAITPGPTQDFYKRCDLKLPNDGSNQRGTRICIGNDFVTWEKTPPQTNYAASLLDLVINQGFLPPANKPSSYDYNWNPVTPNGCRDIIGATVASILVGPNVPGGIWDPSMVLSISVAMQSIQWDE